MHVKAALRVSLTVIFCGILSLFTGSAFAQGSRTITGNIRDEKGLPMAGASISVKGTQRGATTDSTGNFTLTVADNHTTLLVAYVGYETQEINISKGVSFNVQLSPDRNTRQLEDMVVVGYGTQRKVNLTGSVASVTS